MLIVISIILLIALLSGHFLQTLIVLGTIWVALLVLWWLIMGVMLGGAITRSIVKWFTEAMKD